MEEIDTQKNKTNTGSSNNAVDKGGTAVFRRSSIISRTPPQPAAVTSNTPATSKAESNSASLAASQRRINRVAAHGSSILEWMTGTPTRQKEDKQLRQLNSPRVMDSHQRNLTSPSNNNSESEVCSLTDLIGRLGKEIDCLMEYADTHRNVHNDIRKMVSKIKFAHTEMTIRLEEEKNEPKVIFTPLQMRKTTRVAAKNTTLPEKRLRSKISPEIVTHEGANSPDPKKIRSKSPQKSTSSATTEIWQKVQRKKKPTKARKTHGSFRLKSDAIVLQKNVEGTTYADMVRAVKSSVELKDLSEKVKTMRTTQRGGLLIELKKREEGDSTDYQKAFEKALGGIATVNLKTHTVTLQCKSLISDLNTTEELLEAISEQAQVRKPDKTAIKSVRATFGGTQSVYISLQAEDAKKVLALGYLKVGWVRSRVTEVISPKRCFKCWAYDHVARTCNGPDRTKICRRCGKDGHQAAICTNAEKCVLCEGSHSASNAKCPCYQKAVRKIRT